MHKKSNYILPALCLIMVFVFIAGYKYRNLISYDFLKTTQNEEMELNLFFSQWDVFGIDVSEYQGKINWKEVNHIYADRKIHFAFIRATAGKDKVDKHFTTNWKATKNPNIVRGAYHYYRPDENSTEQAHNFIKHVKLNKGDLPPVLDIEQVSKIQSMDRLKLGLQNWLNIVEDHYGVQPIIYSGSTYYTTFLKEEFHPYKLWVANYNNIKTPVNHDWIIWQYSERGKIHGIAGHVDLNVFDGSYEHLRLLCIE